MIGRSLLAILVLASACSRSPKQAFEETARHVNPALLKMRSAAETLKVLRRPEVTIAACTSVDTELMQIRSLRVREYADVLDADSYRAMWGLAYHAEALLTSRDAFCLNRPLRTCSDWCTSNWWRMFGYADTLRRHAGEELVEIIALR